MMKLSPRTGHRRGGRPPTIGESALPGAIPPLQRAGTHALFAASSFGRGRKRIHRLLLAATFGTSFQPPSSCPGVGHPVPISGGRSAGRAATARHADTGRPAGWGSPGVGFAPWQLVVVARKSVARGKKAGRYVLSARPPRGRCGAGGGGDWPIHRPGPARQAAVRAVLCSGRAQEARNFRPRLGSPRSRPGVTPAVLLL